MPVYGTAGGSLKDATFTANKDTAAIGREGELRTARILDRMAGERGFTVIHDLRIPGAQANIDHIVVAGKKVWVIDSKLWRDGFYMTLGGKTYRNLERITHADKRGIPLGHRRIGEFLTTHGARPAMQNPLMVIHPSKGKRPSLWAYRPASDPGAKVRAIHPHALRFPAKAADPHTVSLLLKLTY